MGRRTRWILIGLGVLLLVAFFVQRVVLPGDGADGERLGFQALLAQVDGQQIERVRLDARNDRAEIKLLGRPATVDVPYPDGYEEALVERLLRAQVPLEVEGRSVWLELLVYYGPFAAFWFWLARRLPRRPHPPSGETPGPA